MTNRKALSSANPINPINNNEVLVVDQSYIYPAMSNLAEWSATRESRSVRQSSVERGSAGKPYFKSPQVYQSPRMLQIGMKLNY